MCCWADATWGKILPYDTTQFIEHLVLKAYTLSRLSHSSKILFFFQEVKFIPKLSGNGQVPHPYRSEERGVTFSKVSIAPLCWDFPTVSVAGSVIWFLQECEELGKYHCSDFGSLALTKYQSYLKSSLPSLNLCHLEASWLRELFAWAESNLWFECPDLFHFAFQKWIVLRQVKRIFWDWVTLFLPVNASPYLSIIWGLH